MLTDVRQSISAVTFAFPERTDGESHAFARDWLLKFETELQLEILTKKNVISFAYQGNEQ